MPFWKVVILAGIQGACELLPISSSAHVIMAEKLMGLDPTAPEMTLLVVMLHTGTMLAVIVYFSRKWRARYFSSAARFASFAKLAALATGLTGAIGLTLMFFIERGFMRGEAHADIEQLFGNLYIIAAGLAATGAMIGLSGKKPRQGIDVPRRIKMNEAAWIGVVQGICLPLRGLSRSGSTISMGLILGIGKEEAEDFSFALAVVLTPVVLAKEGYRLLKAHDGLIASASDILALVWPSIGGMIVAFAAGLAALKWLSCWLADDRWNLFGYYCLIVAAAVLTVAPLLPL